MIIAILKCCLISFFDTILSSQEPNANTPYPVHPNAAMKMPVRPIKANVAGSFRLISFRFLKVFFNFLKHFSFLKTGLFKKIERFT